MRRADDPLLGVVVGRASGAASVQPGEAAGALAVAGMIRRGQAEKIEVQVRLTLMKPVVAPLIVVLKVTQSGELGGDSLPLADGQVQQVVAAAQQVDQRPVVEGLVKIVGPRRARGTNQPRSACRRAGYIYPGMAAPRCSARRRGAAAAQPMWAGPAAAWWPRP